MLGNKRKGARTKFTKKHFVHHSESFKRTYGNVENTFLKGFRFVSNWIERILFNERYGKLVALSLATLICVIVQSGADGNIFTNYMKQAIELKDVGVTTNISPNIYEVEGLPKTVNVTVSGDTNDVQYASQQQSNYRVSANLAELGEGTYEVELEPLNFSDRVSVTVEPNVVVVSVKRKTTRSFTLGYEYTNTNKIDNIYTLSPPELSQNDVLIRASEERMNEIAYVKALIDVSDQKADFEVGANIVAYSQTGELLDVDIIPSQITAKVKVTSHHKTIPLEVEFTGKLPDNMAIESYELDKESVTLYGAQEILDEISKLTISVPLTNITEEITTKSITVPLKLPSDTSVKADSLTLKVDVKFNSAENRSFNDIPIKFANIPENLNVKNSTEYKTSIELKGIKSIIEEMKSSDFEIIADLEDCAAGTCEVQLNVKKKNILVLYTIEDEIIKVELE